LLLLLLPPLPPRPIGLSSDRRLSCQIRQNQIKAF
jgi:hypothetical protein